MRFSLSQFIHEARRRRTKRRLRATLRQFIRLPRRRLTKRRKRQEALLLPMQQEWPSTPGPELQARAASSPWPFPKSFWSPTLATILSKTPERHRSVVRESYQDLRKYNLLQRCGRPRASTSGRASGGRWAAGGAGATATCGRSPGRGWAP